MPGTPGATTGRARGLSPAEWRYLWQFRHEVLTDRRRRLRAALGPVTGPPAPVRGEARALLRRMVAGPTPDPVRMAAAVALGRCGAADDARAVLAVANDPAAPDAVREAGVLALGLFAGLEEKADRALTRALREAGGGLAPTAWIGLGARSESVAAARTAAALALARPDPAADALPELFFAARLVGPELIRPELTRAARKSKFWQHDLGELERAYATYSLAGFRTDADLRALARVATSRRAGPHTRRAAAFALLNLAEETWPEREARTLQTSLLHLFRRARDPVVRAFAAFGLGQLATNEGATTLMAAFDDAREARVLKPVIALGVAGAARARPEWKQLANFLYARARDEKHPEARLALETALGYARVTRGIPLLRESLRDERADPMRRAWAAAALGAIGARDEKAIRDLWRAFEAAEAGPLSEHCAVALALLGERASVLRTCDALKRETAADARARCAATLGVLGGPEAVTALRDRLADNTETPAVRAMAAVGLGLALDRRPVDPLARLKTRIFYATTSRALYEVLQIR